MANEVQAGIIMGSRSDWETMRHAAETLDALGVTHEGKVVSAHRAPDRFYPIVYELDGDLKALDRYYLSER